MARVANYEQKIELCKKAELLVEDKDAVKAFNELQKLHEEWKEIGPVSKENREEIWERFKAATSKVNKRHQDFFSNLSKNVLKDTRYGSNRKMPAE